MFGMNPGTRRMWAASDADLPGSGAALEQWAMGEIQKAAGSGALDLNDSTAVRGFLGSLGITPEKGGGRALFNKFMQPGGALAQIRSKVPAGTASAAYGLGPRPNSYSDYGSAQDAARHELTDRYGAGSTLGSIGLGPRPNSYSDFGSGDWGY